MGKEDVSPVESKSSTESVRKTTDVPLHLVMVQLDKDENENVVYRCNDQGVSIDVVTEGNIDVSHYDGLILPGGAPDIDPARYSEENQGAMDVDPELDQLQFSVLDQFVAAGKPVLGICRGCQVINVYFGGTLIQHLGYEESIHYSNTHKIEIDHDSVLGSIYGDHLKVWSYHHQAVDQLGTNLNAVAWAEDGVIEAIEHESLPVYGVQFHPEGNQKMVGMPIFHEFVRICKDYKQAQQ
jgi:putative glutamine amidotransferase